VPCTIERTTPSAKGPRGTTRSITPDATML
jgi:hypothetical protein